MTLSTTNRDTLIVQFALNGALVVSLLTGFWPAMVKLMFRWNAGDNTYCFLVVPLFVYLCWDQKRSQVMVQGQKTRVGFAFNEFSWHVVGIFIGILAVGFIVIGEIGAVELLLYFGLWLAAVAVAALLYGWRIKQLWFNFLILAFLIPLPPFINRILTFELKLAASSLSVEMLRSVGISVLQYGNIIDLGITQLQVVDACSGLRYLIPMILMAMLIGHFFCKGWWRQWFLLTMVPPLSIAMNALRIFLSGLLSINGHERLAQNVFHDVSGLLLFLITSVMLTCTALLLKKAGRPHVFQPTTDKGGQRAVKFKATALAGTMCLIFLASGWAIQKIPSPRNLPERSQFENFPTKIGAWEGRKKYISKNALNLLGADDYMYATYHHSLTGNPVHLLIPFYNYQTTRHTAHAPQSCMLGSGWDFVTATTRTFPGMQRNAIPVRTIVWQQGDTRLLAGYFFLQRGRVFTNPWINKIYLMRDGLLRQRTDGALVRAELQVLPGQSIDEAWDLLSGMLHDIWPMLPQYVPE